MADSPDRRTAFVLASVAGHAMIVNRLDYAEGTEGGCEIGVGFGLLERGHHEPAGIGLLADIATFRRQSVGPGVIIIDGGANIGTYTVPLARFMHGWGSVVAFEPQEWPYYALAGNLALNNCFNAAASRTGLSFTSGRTAVPAIKPDRPVNFGSTSLKKLEPGPVQMVPTLAIDDLGLMRLDIIKLDVEGMEPDVLDGAKATIARLKPILMIEWTICGKEPIAERLPDYELMPLGMELLAVHRADPALQRLKFVGGPPA